MQVSTPLREVEMILKSQRSPLKKFEDGRIVASVPSREWNGKAIKYPISFRKVRQNTEAVFATVTFGVILAESSLKSLARCIDRCCYNATVSADPSKNILIVGIYIHPDAWENDITRFVQICDRIFAVVNAIRSRQDWDENLDENLVYLAFFPHSFAS